MDRGINIAIVNGEYRSSLLTHPPDGRRPDLTPEGERRVAAYRALRDQFEQYDHPEVRGLRVGVSRQKPDAPPALGGNVRLI